MPLASPPWLLLASLSELAARESMEGCAGVPAPQDQESRLSCPLSLQGSLLMAFAKDFTATGADTLGKHLA